MKTIQFSTLLVLFLLSTLFLTNTFAQDYIQLNLPKGAKARLGKGVITDIQLSVNGKYLAVASSIGVWLYDVNTGSETALITGHTETVTHVAFSPDGKTLASISDNLYTYYKQEGTILLWDVPSK